MCHEVSEGHLQAKWKAPPYLVTIVHSRHDLPEEVPGLPLTEASPLADVIIQLSFAGIFHDDHNLIFVLKHCGGGEGNKQTLLASRTNYDFGDEAKRTMEMSLGQMGVESQSCAFSIRRTWDNGSFTLSLPCTVDRNIPGSLVQTPFPLTRSFLTSLLPLLSSLWRG